MIVHRYEDYNYKGFTLSIRDNKGRLVPFKETELNTQGAFNNYYSDYTEMLEKFVTIINTYLRQKEDFPEENEEIEAERNKEEEGYMNTKYMKDEHIIQVLNAIEQKITSNPLVRELISDKEFASYQISNNNLIYKIEMDLVAFDALKLSIDLFFDKNHDLLRQMVQDLEFLFYLLSEDIVSRSKRQDFLDRIDKADDAVADLDDKDE